MNVYRVERKKNLGAPLSGIGASLTKGNRWNSLGTELMYTADSRALATLEVAVHLDLNEDLPTDRYYVEIEIPEDIPILEVHIKDLPSDWNSKPPSITTQTIGDDFVREGEAAVLKVPSSIIPDEFNYLISPNHPDAKRIRVRNKIFMSFDERFKLKK